MKSAEIAAALGSMVVLVDTREHNTACAQKRFEQFGTPYESATLPFGDYSAYCTLPNGERFSLVGKCHIERKMSLTELSNNFFQHRERFAREFERARDAGAKMYLLVENGSVDKIYRGDYRTAANPNSFTATMFTWLARYNCHLLFCDAGRSRQVIHDILYRELKERLMEAVRYA